MAKIDLTSQEWCQLIFEGKNQAYGAYKMRANSTKRHNLAMLAVLVIALIGFTIPTLVKLATPKQKEVMTEVTTLSKLAEPEIKQEEMKRVEPVAPPPPALKSSIKFTPEQEKRFVLSSTFGVPIRSMQKFLDLPEEQRDKILKNEGIPCDSVDNQFKSWVRNARAANADLRIAIKADASTPYSVIKNVMNSLQDLRENRYNLITSLKVESED